MEASNKEVSLIVYIDSTRAYFYSESLGNVLQLDFPQDIVSDLEIVNKDKFLQLFNIFIQRNIKGLGISKFNVILIFSPNTTFDKDLAPIINKDIEEQEREFLGLAPFEDVLSKTYKLNKNTRVVVANNSFYEMINDIFHKNKLLISMVIPYSVLQIVHPEFSNQMDLALLLQKADSYKQYNMVDEEDYGKIKNEDKKSGKKLNVRLISMVVVFAILLLIMTVFGYRTFFQSNSINEEELIQAFTPTPVQVIESTPTPIPEVVVPATPSGEVDQLGTESANPV